MRKVIVTKKIISFDNHNDFGFLEEIKGIGKKTIKDIERVYSTKEELKIALRTNNCPLRDDQVIKLKEYFKI